MADEEQNIEVVKCFLESASKLDAGAIDQQLTPDFEMFSNDVHWDFQTYKDYHVESYKTRKAITFDYQDIFSSKDRVAARVNITLTNPDNSTKEFQVMLIAQITGDRISKLWELTFPHWA